MCAIRAAPTRRPARGWAHPRWWGPPGTVGLLVARRSAVVRLTLTRPGLPHIWNMSTPPVFNYQRNNTQRTVLAHRFAVELVHGLLDDSVVCEHKCNEPLCRSGRR